MRRLVDTNQRLIGCEGRPDVLARSRDGLLYSLLSDEPRALGAFDTIGSGSRSRPYAWRRLPAMRDFGCGRNLVADWLQIGPASSLFVL
jgi:hypothetical protein